MPFFEYKCNECDKVFTLLQKRDAPREGHECPACGATATERVFSTFATGKGEAAKVTAGGGGGGGGHCCGGGCGCRH